MHKGISTRAWFSAALCIAAAILAVFGVATAHTVGGPCSSAAEKCENWSAIVPRPTPPPGHRPDEFPISVAISGGTVFAGATAVDFNTSDPYKSTASWSIVAYDKRTGAERWHVFRKSREYDSLHSVVVSPDGKTIVATGGAYNGFPVGATDGRIVTVAFDSQTGAERWAATWDGRADALDNSVAARFSPDGARVFVGGVTTPETSGDLNYVTIAYDAASGAQLWASIYNGLGIGGTNSLYDLAVSPDGKRVYATGESAGRAQFELDYATVAYDAANGAQLWESRSTPTFVDRACCIAVDDERVYVTGNSYTGPKGGDYQALTVAMRASDGAVQWQQRLGGAGYNGSRAMTIGGGRVVITTQSPSMANGQGLTALTAAYNATTGQQLWVTPLAESVRSQLANDLAMAPDNSLVYMVASSRPNVQYTALNEQQIVAYNMSNGSVAWTVKLDSGTLNALTGEKIVAGATGDSIATFGRITRSADPTGPPDQNIYDALVVEFPANTGGAATPTPSPTATASPTATPSVTPTPSPTSTPTPTATATATPTPSPTATPTPAQLLNISGRVLAQTGDNVAIAGFISGGNDAKRVILRGIGPSMRVKGEAVAGALRDPVIELHDAAGSLLAANDNWRSDQESEIQSTGLAPADDRDAAIIRTLPPGEYTAIVKGADGSSGLALAEVFDLQRASGGELGNLSVRAYVGTGDDVLIDGIIIGTGEPKDVLFRALGPSLASQKVANALHDPTMELRDANGALLLNNNNWRDALNARDIESTGLAPHDDRESAILLRLAPGNYTAIVRGVSNATGVALAEVYKLN